MNNSKVLIKREWTSIGSLDESKVGQKVLIRARIATSRLQGANLCFLQLREKLFTVQAVIAKGGVCSKSMVKFAGDITRESIVDIEGTISKTQVPIESATQKNVELHVTSLFVVSEAQQLPILLEDLSRNQALLDQQDSEINEISRLLENTSLTNEEKEELTAKKSAASRYVNVGLSQRLQNRYLDLRVPANLSIFRIQSAVCALFREFLSAKDFTEIHSPKIISTASESGASVFKLGYFNTHAYLAQSPQFYKQMAIASDFDRVFEIAPVFRAENSNTHRHLTEFVGLDMEMAFKDHYHEVLDTLDEMMCFIFKGLESRFNKELETINGQYPFEPFKFTYPSPRFTFDEAAKFLAEEAELLKDETYIVQNNDFSTRQEKKLGQIIKKKFGVDFFIVDKFHTEVRPFYTMPDPNNPGLANAYDLFMRGEEICSGAQRIHDAKLLEENAKHHGINVADIQSYIDSFKFGCSQHAGGGVGLERVVMLYLGIFNIRKTSLFPRDPQTLLL
ncbi:hypothetical protein DICPUDRAFT_31743 [Dictyostelium purpureum]|uniref:aspartate--tRNA ligase n=1 Tax=Dictyostelium purpureum TaxID=5786 RepID=F0ZHQ7_DICPU|nr:uncharacterized protein DICPUDRAFT_31743 [Dictyostelium purpureum]EGC36518.1 hypothetical protein DICPUDRAFT_31743 [Dictyostelium purpureum]|eukprot:XP_003286963.1 hypothetical protein DICPUDRAFT_31743 [Dictyostelium purpureum]